MAELTRIDRIEAAKLAAYEVMLNGWKEIQEKINSQPNNSLNDELILARANFWINNDDKILEL